MDYPRLTKELAQEIESLWKDAAIQVAKQHTLIALTTLTLLLTPSFIVFQYRLMISMDRMFYFL